MDVEAVFGLAGDGKTALEPKGRPEDNAMHQRRPSVLPVPVHAIYHRHLQYFIAVCESDVLCWTIIDSLIETSL